MQSDSNDTTAGTLYFVKKQASCYNLIDIIHHMYQETSRTFDGTSDIKEACRGANNMKEDCKKRIKISITGDLGSGKSTVCKYLNEHYGLNVYSTGQIQRSLALKYGMDVLTFNKYMETHPEIDEEIDTELTLIGKRDEDMVLDSRMAWHFVPDTFKVYLKVDPNEAARRVMNDKRGTVEKYDSLEAAKACLIDRKKSENLRYITKYGVDCSNPDNYDLIIDATDISPSQVAEAIMEGYRRHFDCLYPHNI